MRHILAICLAAPVMVILCWKDYRTRTLPNAWTLGLAVLAFSWRLWADGTGGIVDGLLGGLAGALFLLVPFLMRAAGGGDVKMLAAAGVLTGFRLCAAQLLFVSLAGIALAAVFLAARAVSPARLNHLFRCVFDWRYDRVKGRADLPSRADEKCRVPFGVAIAAGTLATLAYAAWLEVTP